jgi:serine/threonine-protein kinase
VYWRAAGGLAPSVHTLLREMLFEPIVPASERAREFGLAERLPPGFDAWFSRTVVREPEARFPDANVALAELLTCGFPKTLAAYPLPAPPPSGPSHGPPSHSPPTTALPPQIHTQIPFVSVAPPPERRSSLGVWVGIGGVIVALLAVSVAAAAIFMLSRREPTIATSPVSSAPTVATTESPSATAPAPSAPASASASSPTVQRPRTAASGSAAPAPTEAPKKPFDAAAASKAVNAQAQTAKMICKSMEGPAAMSATVIFSNSGAVKTTQADVEVRVTARGNCALGTLNGSRIQPFDGPASPVPVAIAF